MELFKNNFTVPKQPAECFERRYWIFGTFIMNHNYIVIISNLLFNKPHQFFSSFLTFAFERLNMWFASLMYLLSGNSLVKP